LSKSVISRNETTVVTVVVLRKSVVGMKSVVVVDVVASAFGNCEVKVEVVVCVVVVIVVLVVEVNKVLEVVVVSKSVTTGDVVTVVYMD
jgi:hypothetical protein